MRVRILFLNSNKKVGAYYRGFFLAKELSERGHEVKLMTISPHHILAARCYSLDRLKIVEGPQFLFRPFRTLPFDTILKTLEILRNSYDIVYGFEHFPNVLLPILVTRKLRKYLFISDWCDLHAGGHNLYRNTKFLIALERFLEEKIRRLADGVTVIVEPLRARAISAGIGGDRVFLLREGVDPSFIRPLPVETCRRKFGIPLDAKVIASLYDARTDVVVNVFKEVLEAAPHCFLVLIGRGRKDVGALIKTLSIEKRVLETGFCSDEELNEYLACSNVCFLPLEDNNLNRFRYPHKLGDYMAAGKPIVTNPVGDVGALFEAKKVGLLCGFNTKEFAEKIIWLFDHPEKAEELGRNGRGLVEEELNWKKLTDEFEGICKALEEKRRGASFSIQRGNIHRHDQRGFFDTISQRISVEEFISPPSISKDQFDAFYSFCHFKPDSNILDLGSGTGTFTIPLLLRGHRVTAVDNSGRSLDKLKTFAEAMGLSGGLTVLHEDVRTLPNSLEGKFDYVVCRHLLHHVEEFYKLLAEMDSFLDQTKSYSCVALLEPNGKWPFWRLYGLFDRTFVWRYEKGLKEITVDALSRFFRRRGIENFSFKYYSFLPGQYIRFFGLGKLIKRLDRWITRNRNIQKKSSVLFIRFKGGTESKVVQTLSRHKQESKPSPTS